MKTRYASDSEFLPGLGWDCPNPACGVFNGDLKDRRSSCRSCDTPRPGSPLAILSSSVDELEASVRLLAFLKTNGCKTIGDARELYARGDWKNNRKIGKELFLLLVELQVEGDWHVHQAEMKRNDRIAKMSDLELLAALLADDEVTEEERKSFEDMRRRAIADNRRLFRKQRSWAEEVMRRITPLDASEVPRGKEVETPEVLRNLPKKPPTARRVE